MSKRKGGRYEREFVARVQDHGLPARKVPLSGAVAEYPGDVEVCDEVLVECKYRRNGTGFKRLYDWMAGHHRMEVVGDGVQLLIRTLDEWCRVYAEVNPPDNGEWHVKQSSSSFSGLRKWVGECRYLAVRMPRCEWLVIQVIEQ